MSQTTAMDKAEIREIFSEYCFRMDDRDYVGLATLFTEDGEWEAAYSRAKGRREIAELMEQVNPDPEVGPYRKHMVLNSRVTVDGDTARSRTAYLVMMAGETGPVPIVVGTYEDQLIRDPASDSWHIARRRLVHEIVGDLGHALRLPGKS